MRLFSSLTTKKHFQEWCCVVDGSYIKPCSICAFSEPFLRQYIQLNQIRQKKQNQNWNSKGKSREILFTSHNKYEHYKILNLENDFKNLTKSLLKQKFKEASLIYHPDTKTGSTEQFQTLINSYEIILLDIE